MTNRSPKGKRNAKTVNPEVVRRKNCVFDFRDSLTLYRMSVTGDILHEDPERDCRVYLTSACLTGKIENASVFLDQGSRWYATADSHVVIAEDLDVAQIDAPIGVTITATAAEGQGTYSLSSGGTLVVQ